MNNTSVKPNRFLVHWTLFAILIWPISLFLSIFLWVPLSVVLGFLGNWAGLEPVVRLIEIVTILTIPSLVAGYAIGEIQKTLARDDLDWHLNNWLKLSMLGGLSGGLSLAALFSFANNLEPQLLWILAMPIFMLILSSLQWLEMRKVAREAWLWVLGNISAACVFSGLLFMNQLDPISESYTFLSFGLWILATVAQGMITGIVLLCLYDRPIVDSEDELAPVYLEVRSRDDS